MATPEELQKRREDERRAKAYASLTPEQIAAVGQTRDTVALPRGSTDDSWRPEVGEGLAPSSAYPVVSPGSIGEEDFEGYWIPRYNQPLYPTDRFDVGPGGVSVSRDQNPLFSFLNGDGAMLWNGYAAENRAMREVQLVNAGLLTEGGFTPGAKDKVQHDAWETVLWYANYYGVTPYNALARLEKEGRQDTSGSGSGARGPVYSVPAQYRTIPDWKALAQESRGIFRQTLGRDLEDWELTLLGNSLKDEYISYNDQSIVAHKAAWDDAVSGGTTDVEYVDVPLPGASLAFDIEEDYGSEIDRNVRVFEGAQNRTTLMNSISTGRRMATG